VTDPVVLDGYTQPGSSPNTLAVGDNSVHLIELNGNGAAFSGLTISAGNSMVRGLVINRFDGGNSLVLETGGGNTITGNFIGTNAAGTAALGSGVRGLFISSSGNQIGGTTPAARNVIVINTGIQVAISSNIVQGNYIGTNAAGTALLPAAGNSGGIGVSIEQFAGNIIGGTAPGAGNVIAGYGEGIRGTFVTGSFIQGNYIGTNPAGAAGLGNSIGIRLLGNTSNNNNTIGGTAAGAGNVISGNTGNGVVLSTGAISNNLVQGNLIGLAPDGTTPRGNGGHGVEITPGENNSIGGLADGAGNRIAFNGGDGVFVSVGSGNAILRNSIFLNTGLAIDLDSNGVTANDPCDADTGANNLQNYPVIKSVTNTPGSINITGTLNSSANTTFRLEFFSNDVIDPSGFGEGQVFLGFTNVTTDASCNATFNVNFPSPTAAQRVTATATDPLGNTSEFSAAIGQLLNIATRLRVQTGDNVLIGGFIITGTDPKKVIARGIGPSLAAFFPDFLADPTLELFQGNTLLASNDNWKTRPDGTSQQVEIEATTLAPTNDLEAALVRDLPANNTNYTAIVRGKNNTTGIGVVETYDLDTTANSKLANISTRGLVETGNNVLIGGFIPGNGLTKVIVRAIGPTLINVGVANPLQDPTLELHDGSGTTIRSNDNWKVREDGSSQQGEIEATTIPPANELESALVQTLAPGNYTAIVRGKNNTTGTAVVEVYNIP
jgi:hypothetical protein